MMKSKTLQTIFGFPVKHLYMIGCCCAISLLLSIIVPSESAQAKRSIRFKTTAPIGVDAEWATIQAADQSSKKEDTEHQDDDVDNPLPPSWHRIRAEIQADDTLSSLFKRYQIDNDLLSRLTQKSQHKELFSHIHPGQTLTLDFDSRHQLQGLSLKVSPFKYYVASRLPDDNFDIHTRTLKPDTQVAFAHATIDSSLFTAGQQANLSEKLVMQLAKIFAWDIDFAQDIHPGDQFSVVYETHYIRGEKVGAGDILAAEFINGDRHFTAIRFEDPKTGEAGYYTPNGEPLHKTFLRTPVDFTRISSLFSIQREHPVLHMMRAHKGVDYAAPRGTPVKAAGDGQIVFANRKGGYGNVVMIQHGPQYRTVYAHLNNYAKNIKAGMKVHQGDVIGFVGSTGLATGPHLHYEFQVNGVHQNPLTVKLPNGPSIERTYLANFKTRSQFLLNQLALAKSKPTVIASSR